MNTSFFSWKRVVVILILGLGIAFFIPKIVGLNETWQVVKEVKYWALILALASEVMFYLGSAILTRTVLKMTSDHLDLYDVLKISIMDSFSVQFLPLGTFGETAVDYYFYRAKNIRTSHIVLMFISRTIIIWVIFAFIYLLGVAFSPTNNSFSQNHILTIWIIYFIALFFFTYLISLFYRRELLLKRAHGALKFLNWFLKLFRQNPISKEKVPQTIDKVYESTYILANNRDLQLSAITGALFFWFGDIFCLYFSFFGFGYHPNLPIVIFAYCIAKILSIVSFIPGGLGIMEASLGLIFVGFGVPGPIAISSVLLFRLISFWLPIPLGFWSFLSLQKKSNKVL